MVLVDAVIWALPLLLLLLFALVSPWTDRKGWTRFGTGRGATRTMLNGYGGLFNPEIYRAVEYQKAVHDEEEHADGKPTPFFFPAIACDAIALRRLADEPADLMLLQQWLDESAPDLAALQRQYITELPGETVPCLIERDGTPIGYLQFGATPPVFTLERLLGGQALTDADATAAVRLLLAYLFEMEAARHVRATPGADLPAAVLRRCGFTPAGTIFPTMLPPCDRRFHLVIGAGNGKKPA